MCSGKVSRGHRAASAGSVKRTWKKEEEEEEKEEVQVEVEVEAIRKRKKKKKRRKRKRKRRKKKCAKLTRKTREAFGYSQPTIIPSRKMNHPVDRLSRYVDGEIEATERRCLASETAGAAT